MEFDVSAAVTALGGIVAAIALIGGAKMLPGAAVAGWNMLKSAVQRG